MKKLITVLFICFFVFLNATTVAEAGRGCCSHHGGVSHCDSSVGRQVCNDGTYSPSCGCARTVQTPVQTDSPISKLIEFDQYQATKFVESKKTEYLSNPHWFREKLINELANQYKLLKLDAIAGIVYSILRDVKP